MLIFLLLTGCTLDEQNNSDTVGKPNILLILVDDMGYGDLKSYNPESKIPTPNLDKLASEGMRFTDAHAPGAVCHPSRYGLLTGRYPFRTNTNVWPEQPVIDKDRMTIASLLKAEGYHTAMVGKWHLGFDESAAIQASREDSTQSGNNTRAAYRTYEEGQILSGGPVNRGFNSFFGIRASTDIPPYFYIRDDRVVNPPSNTIGNKYSGGIWTDIQGAFWREGGISPDFDLADVLPRIRLGCLLKSLKVSAVPACMETLWRWWMQRLAGYYRQLTMQICPMKHWLFLPVTTVRYGMKKIKSISNTILRVVFEG